MAKQARLVPVKIEGRNLPWCVSVPPHLSETGSRTRRFFATKVEATTFVDQTKARVLNHGIATHGLTAGQKEAAAASFRLLGDEPPSALIEIVRQHLARKTQQEESVSFAKLRDIFISSKGSRSGAYLRQVRAAFLKFSLFDDTVVAAITSNDISNALEGTPSSARNAHLRVAKAAFNFAARKGWLAANPADNVDFAEIARSEVEVLSNVESESLLRACQGFDPALLPYHLFGLFAGIRPQELERMDWQNVHLDENHILLPAEITKTGTRRVIEVEAGLARWLNWYVSENRNTVGKITPAKNLRRRLRAVREHAGITTWVQDVMRHTYASNLLAVNPSVDTLRANLGHRSVDVLWRHYHKAVLRRDAEKFWAILPIGENLDEAALNNKIATG